MKMRFGALTIKIVDVPPSPSDFVVFSLPSYSPKSTGDIQVITLLPYARHTIFFSSLSHMPYHTIFAFRRYHCGHMDQIHNTSSSFPLFSLSFQNPYLQHFVFVIYDDSNDPFYLLLTIVSLNMNLPSYSTLSSFPFTTSRYKPHHSPPSDCYVL